MGRKIYKGYYLRFYQCNLAFGILSRIPYHSSIFVSVLILTKKVEIDNNAQGESHKVVCDERVQMENIGQENILYNELFLIVNYKYKNNGFL